MTRLPRTMWWADHAEYLLSAKWKEVRRAAMQRAGGRCQRCGKKARQVHHKTYVRTGGNELPGDLEALCAGCHMLHHGIKHPAAKVSAKRQKRKRQQERQARDVITRQCAQNAINKAARKRDPYKRRKAGLKVMVLGPGHKWDPIK